MSDTYTKLFRSIAASTIVSEPLATRWLWVTMLSQADKAGRVYASVPGLARMANISLEECEAGLACFLAPDRYSRTSDNEGRRIEAFDGGWLLLNHAKYDAMRSEAERRDYKREWDRKNRSKAAQTEVVPIRSSDTNPTASDKSDASDPISHSSFLMKEQKQERVQPTAARFADFWNEYPNKKGKADALKTWKRKGLAARADVLIAHVRQMTANDDGWRRGFVPMGSTYLNGDRWEDEPRLAPTGPPTPKPGEPRGGSSTPDTREPTQTPLEAHITWLVDQVRCGAMTKDQAKADADRVRAKYSAENACSKHATN